MRSHCSVAPVMEALLAKQMVAFSPATRSRSRPAQGQGVRELWRSVTESPKLARFGCVQAANALAIRNCLAKVQPACVRRCDGRSEQISNETAMAAHGAGPGGFGSRVSRNELRSCGAEDSELRPGFKVSTSSSDAGPNAFSLRRTIASDLPQ